MDMRKKLQESVMSVPDLPAGFTECEYLESSGTQYLKTDILPTGSMCVTIDVLFTSWDFINYTWGSTVVHWAEGYELGWTPDYNGGWGRRGIYRYGNVSRYLTIRLPQNELNVKYHFVFDRNKVYRDGKLWPFFDDKTLENVEIPEQTFVGTRPIYIFAALWNYGVYSSSGKRFYSFNIKDNGVELINLIPVLDENSVPCMYDTVSKTCFRNKGKGTFGYKIKNSDIVVAPK